MLRHILERHVAEIDALWSRRRQLVVSPRHLWGDRERIDQRIRDHAAALVAGKLTARSVLQHYPTDNDRDATFAVSYPLLVGSDSLAREERLQQLTTMDTRALPGLRDALMHAPLGRHASRLRETMAAGDEHPALAACLILAAHDALSEEDAHTLTALLTSNDPRIRAAAWRVPRYNGSPGAWRNQLDGGLTDPSAQVRCSAMWTAAWHDPTWLTQRWQDGLPKDQTGRALWLAFHDPTEQEFDALTHNATIIERLGLIGDAGLTHLLPEVIAPMQDESVPTRVAAGVAFERITGVNVDSNDTALLHDDPASLDEFDREFLPTTALPDAAMARQYWHNHHDSLCAVRRRHRGVALDSPAPTVNVEAMDSRAVWFYWVRAGAESRPALHSIMRVRRSDSH